MIVRALVVLVLVCAARVARADRAITVEVGAAVPFAAEDLSAALRVRLSPFGEPVHVAVVGTAGGVVVTVHGETQVVPLAGRSGAAAARLVALMASDLLMDDLSSAPPSMVAHRQVAAAAPAIEAASSPPAAVVAATTITTPPRAMVDVLGTVDAWDRAMAGATVDVIMPRGQWLADVDLGVGGQGGGGLRLASGVLRGAGGVRLGPIDLLAGVTFEPIVSRTGPAAAEVLFGAGASVRARLPVGDGASLVLAAGVDSFSNRYTYAETGQPTITTPSIAPWLGVGFEVTP